MNYFRSLTESGHVDMYLTGGPITWGVLLGTSRHLSSYKAARTLCYKSLHKHGVDCMAEEMGGVMVWVDDG